MSGSYEILSTAGILAGGKAADDTVVRAMQASGMLHPEYGASRHEENPAQVIYFPAPGRSPAQMVEVLEQTIETVLPTAKVTVRV
jgi:hypothetical protein